MKYSYNYYEYKDFPVATEISKSRARNGGLLTTAAFWILILSLLFLTTCKTASDWISGIFTVLASIAFIAYMFVVYPRVTEKKIQKAIEESILHNQRMVEKYNSKPATISFIDYRDSTLIILFKNGFEYRHYDVPESVYKQFLSAASTENYYNNYIKDKYPRW